jgi:hypothetical protein
VSPSVGRDLQALSCGTLQSRSVTERRPQPCLSPSQTGSSSYQPFRYLRYTVLRQQLLKGKSIYIHQTVSPCSQGRCPPRTRGQWGRSRPGARAQRHRGDTKRCNSGKSLHRKRPRIPDLEERVDNRFTNQPSRRAQPIALRTPTSAAPAAWSES